MMLRRLALLCRANEHRSEAAKNVCARHDVLKKMGRPIQCMEDGLFLFCFDLFLLFCLFFLTGIGTMWSGDLSWICRQVV